MGAHLRQRMEKEQRMNLTLEYYLRGRSFRDIAKELGCGLSTTKRDIDAIRDEWRRSRMDAYGHEQLHELAKIDAIEREAWSQWEASKKEEVATRAETEVQIIEGANGTVVRKPGGEKVVRTTRLRNADPRYMETIRWCVEQRCKLLGLLAPQKIAPTNPEGTGPAKVVLDLSTLSIEELEALDRVRNRMLGLPSSSGPSLN